MRIGRNKQPAAPQIQMAPMIDVVFQLLIFFLVASEVRPTEADFTTNLPGGTGPRDTKVDAVEQFRLYIEKTDAECTNVKISLNNDPLGQSPEGFRALAARLKNVTANAATKAKMLLIIDGESDIKIQFITNAMDAAVEAEVPKVTFGKPKGGN